MTAPPFEAEDQTDEDFFDKLQDDDDVVGTAAAGTLATAERIGSNLSNLSIGDLSDVGSVEELEKSDVVVSDPVDFGDTEPPRAVGEGNSEDVSAGEPDSEDASAGLTAERIGGGATEFVPEGLTAERVGGGDTESVSEGLLVERIGGRYTGAVSTGLPVESFGGENVEAVSAGLTAETIGGGDMEGVSEGLPVERIGGGDAEVVPMQTIDGGDMKVVSEGLPVERIGGGDDEVVPVETISGGKSAGVKVVDWSEFKVGPMQADLGGFEDLLTESSDISHFDPFSSQWNNSAENSAFASSFTSDVAHTSLSEGNIAYAENAGLDDSQHWESMYPGWKFDSSTGQWSPIDGIDAGNAVSDSCNDRGNDNVDGAENFFSASTSTAVVDRNPSVKENAAYTSLSAEKDAYVENSDRNDWDNMYPGWKFDSSTGQWIQVDGYDPSGKTVPDSCSSNRSSGNVVPGASDGHSVENMASASTLSSDVDVNSSVQTPVTELATYNSSSEQKAQTMDNDDSQYWENMYPGWKFNSSTGQWYQADGCDASGYTVSDSCNNLDSDVKGASGGSVTEQTFEVSYFQQTTQSMVATVTDNSTAINASNVNLVSQGSTEFPSHMVFDPKYPGWYYDTNTQQWLTLDSYYETVQRTSDTVKQYSSASNGFLTRENNGSLNTGLPESVSKSKTGFHNTDPVKLHSSASNGFNVTENTGLYNGAVQYEQSKVQGHNMQDGRQGWSLGSYVQPKTWLPEPVNQSTINFSNDPPLDSFHGSTGHAVNNMDPHNSLNSSIHSKDCGYGSKIGSTSFPSFAPTGTQQQGSVGFSNNQKIGNFDGSMGHAANYQDQQKGLNAPVPFQGHSYARKSDLTDFPRFVPAESQERNSVSFSDNLNTANFHCSVGHAANYTNQHKGLNGAAPFAGHDYGNLNGSTVFPSFVPAENQEQGFVSFSNKQHTQNLHGLTGHAANYMDQKKAPSFVPAEGMYQFSQSKFEQSQHGQYGNQNSSDYLQQQFQSSAIPFSQFSITHSEGRSSAGRPPHALVTFGFGGKLIVMRDANSMGTIMDSGSQDVSRGSLSILSLKEVLTDRINSGGTTSSCDYFRSLCQESFPGPLYSSTNTKVVNKWLDEKIRNCESSINGSGKVEYFELLLSLLKASCQHHGTLRSPSGIDPSLEESKSPESSICKLLASARKNSDCSREYGSFVQCMQSLPTDDQIQATAIEVQNLLVSGKRKEALSCAQAGQLWGPAFVLASQLGDEFYLDTLKQMAHRQLISGSPLRTLCLLIAGRARDVFPETENSVLSDASNASQQPHEISANSLLDDWIENLAIITANRTKDDQLVIIHLGDCLWKRGQINAAHSCFLVAEANFEPYSDSARICLIGADHWRFPRTYVTPEAIQLTEVHQYCKTLANSQFIEQSFQPYKLVYAYMLAEVGMVVESSRYCESISKALKTSARAPEVETLKSLLSSLEERIRTHQQGGFSTNLAPAKIVGKLMTSLDNTIHRMMGAPQPPLPPMPKVANSQSTMAMSSLIPSPSMDAMNGWSGDGNKMSAHNRSSSEPDFGQSPKKDQLKDTSSRDGQNKAPLPGGSSRFGRFGSQLFQKTMGWVPISRSDRQAKLGETNKFYYDEKLKRWVEEGVEMPSEEPALQPPPTIASFQNGTSNFNTPSSFMTQNLAANGESESKPPLPSGFSSGITNGSPSPNHFSARAAGGIRSRYVDTFNKGGVTSRKSFQPPAPSVKPPAAANFFVPAVPASNDEQISNPTVESTHETGANGESSAPEANQDLYSAPPAIIHRFPSMNSIVHSSTNGLKTSHQNSDASFSSRSRASSWSGSYGDVHTSKETRPLGDWVKMTPNTSFMPAKPSDFQQDTSAPQVSGGSVSGDLHEVEL